MICDFFNFNLTYDLKNVVFPLHQ